MRMADAAALGLDVHRSGSGHVVDEQIARYAQSLDFARDEVLGIFNRRLELVAKMRSLGLATVFAGRIFSFEDVDRPKPYPDIYLAAAASCGAAPQDCVVIEDSVPGVRAGIAAGCRVLGFAHETPRGVLAAHGAEPFAAWAELDGLLGL